MQQINTKNQNIMKHFVLSLVAMATLCVPALAQNKVKNVYASSATLNTEQLSNTEQTVQLNRYLFAGYNTLCLPMSVSAEQLQGTTLERFVGIGQEGTTLCLYFIDCTAEGIEAGVPYLVFSPTAQYLRVRNTESARISDNLENVRISDAEGNTVSFGSSWETIRCEGRYGIPAKQDVQILESVLVRTDADKAFLPTRCGFSWEQQSSSATDLAIRHIKSLDEATGINTIKNEELKIKNDVYDLSGRKVSNVKKGIVIENGKKVLK